jgi:hypothetical protein
MTLAFKARVNDETIASYRYRVLAPIAFLAARGHAVERYDDGNFDRYETVVFSKAYAAADRKLARRLKAAGKRVLLDLCDNHFFNPWSLPKYREARASLLAMIAICDGVVCSTPVLARAVQQEAGLAETPAVAPDVYEQAEVRAGPPSPPDQPARLLWFGRHGSPNAPAGMEDLLLIRDELAGAHAKRALELVVCSDSRERFDELLGDFVVPSRFAPWSPESFAVELARADGVVIPLSDNPFVAAKTHNRLSLVLSAGVPAIADRLDSYQEFAPFAWIGDWAGGLEAVLLRPQEARARAAGAAAYLEAHWSAGAIAPLWEAALALPDGAGPRRVEAEPMGPVAHVLDFFAAQGRSRRPWLIVGPDADPAEVAAARAGGLLALSLGASAARAGADLAFVVDAEELAGHGPDLPEAAACLMVPTDLHVDGWASGRGLASWAADVPALRRFAEAGRLVRADLWTGAGEGVDGDFDSEEAALRLLARAGVREVRSLGVRRRRASCPGLDGLASILERRSGGLEELTRRTGLSYAGYREGAPA